MRKWWLCLCLCMPLFLAAQKVQTGTQDTLSVNFSDLPLEIIFDSISYKTGYFFAYDAEAVTDGSLYSLERKTIEVDALLNTLLVGTGLRYTRIDDQIIIKKTPPKQPKTQANRLYLSGYVREYETKRPISGANVYLNGTTIGTVTDQHGNYYIDQLPKGFNTLVFSHVGYELVSYDLEVSKEQHYVVNAQLRQDIIALQGIEVTTQRLASDEDWARNFKVFETEFIGTSLNAESCEILNPEVLDFHHDTNGDTLFAVASEPLIIHNSALGYALSYDLIYFKKTTNWTNFYGHARFSNLGPADKRTLRKWKKNRKRSFRGSIFHFLQSLTKGRLFEEGFRMFTASAITDKSPTRVASSEVLRKVNPINWQLSFDQYLIVVYENELESTQYLSEQLKNDMRIGRSVTTSLANVRPGAQKSVLELNAHFVTIDRFGQIKEPGGVTILGYWAWERIADMMPADYHPKTDKL